MRGVRGGKIPTGAEEISLYERGGEVLGQVLTHGAEPESFEIVTGWLCKAQVPCDDLNKTCASGTEGGDSAHPVWQCPARGVTVLTLPYIAQLRCGCQQGVLFSLEVLLSWEKQEAWPQTGSAEFPPCFWPLHKSIGVRNLTGVTSVCKGFQAMHWQSLQGQWVLCEHPDSPFWSAGSTSLAVCRVRSHD